MPETPSPRKLDIPHILAWAIVLPVLSAWPFLSAMPLFTLIGGNLSPLALSINLVLLLFGFWPLAAAYAAYAFLRADGSATPRPRIVADRGLLLGGYAALWTSLYLIVVYARP